MLLKKEVQVGCFSHQTVFYIKSVQVKPSVILQFNLNASGIILNCTTISVLFIVIVSTSTPQKSNTLGFWKTQFFLFSFDFKAYLIHKLPAQQIHTEFRKPGFRLQQSQHRIHQCNLRNIMSVLKESICTRQSQMMSNCNCILYIPTYILEN